MVDIRIKDLPSGTPNASKKLAMDLTTTESATIKDIVYAGRPAASQVEAEAGTDAEKAMTPLTSRQAIDARALLQSQAGSVGLDILASTTQAEAIAAVGVDSSNFATAAQGDLADTALQPSDLQVIEDRSRDYLFFLDPSGSDITTQLQALMDELDFYQGGAGGTIRLGSGIGYVSSSLNHRTGVELIGAGSGGFASQLRSTVTTGGGLPVISAKSDFTPGAFKAFGSAAIRNILIRGGGNTLANAHGIDSNWAQDFVIEDVICFSTRAAVHIANSAGTALLRVKTKGAGADRSHYGLHMYEDFYPELAYDNNSVIAVGCQFLGINQTSFKLENFAGSKFLQCQGLEGNIGWHLGDPGNKGGHGGSSSEYPPVQFASFVDCEADSCYNAGWLISKGNAPYLGSIWMDTIWNGLTGSNGVESGGDETNGAFWIVGADDLRIGSITSRNELSPLRITNSKQVSIGQLHLKGVGRSGVDFYAILMENARHCNIGSIMSRQNPGALSTNFLIENSGSDFNYIGQIDQDGGAIIKGGATSYFGTLTGTDTSVTPNVKFYR